MSDSETTIGKGAPKGFTFLMALVFLGVPSIGFLFYSLYEESFIFLNFYTLLYYGIAVAVIIIIFLGERGIINAGKLTEFSVYKQKKKGTPNPEDTFVNSIEDLNRLKSIGEITDEQFDFYKKKLMETEFKKQSAKLAKKQ